MRLRNKIILATVSVIVLVVLGFAAVRYKQGQLAGITRGDEAKNPGPPRILSEFTVIERVNVADPNNALGHRFSLQDENGAHYSVALYFVECPPTELSDDSNTRLARLANYFGNVPLEHMLEGGKQARDFTLKQLQTRPFKLATLFYPTKNHSGFHTFVLLRGDQGDEYYLSEMLVKNGLAAITAEVGHLPYGERHEVFRNYLFGLQRKARADKVGIWAHSRDTDEDAAAEAPSGPEAP